MKKLFLGIAVLIAMFSLAQISSASIINGGFETGNLTGWTIVGSGGTQTAVPTVGLVEGGNAGRITPPTAVGGFTTLSQTLDLNVGDTLEGWYSLRNSNRFGTYPAYARIIESDNDIIDIWTVNIPQQPGVLYAYTSPWTAWSWEALESGTYTLQFGISNPSGKYGGVVYIDGITLTEAPPAMNPTPEPATMILFGLGLLGLAGVSRKKSSGINPAYTSHAIQRGDKS